MAKLQMQRVYLCALKKDRQDILDTLQRLETVEVRDFVDEDVMDNIPEDEENRVLRENIKINIEDTKNAIEIIKTMSGGKVTEPFFLKGRESLSDSKQAEYLQTNYADDLKIVEQIVKNNENIRDQRSEIAHINAKLETLKPWENLELSLDFEGTKSTKLIIGTLPGDLSKVQIEQIVVNNLDKDNSSKDVPFEVSIVSKLDVLTYFTLICLRKDEEKILNSLRSAGFIPPVVDGDKTVKEMQKDLDSNLKLSQDSIKASEDVINANLDKIENLRFLLDFETLRLDSYSVTSKLFNTHKTFVLKGYVPKKYADELNSVLTSKFAVEVRFEDVDEYDEDAPVLLKNPVLSEPVESVIEAYSLPSAKDVDPTLVVSIFYYFMFGLMLSDAGYGFIIMVASIVGLVKFKDNLEIGWKKTLRMYALAGGFTVFWGIMFGSYFGDLVDTVARTFFGADTSVSVAPPVWFNPVNEPMRLLKYSLIIGIIHLFVGIFLKGVTQAKQKDYKSMISEVVLWYGLLVGCIILLVGSEMIGSIFGYDHSFMPAFVLSFGKILAMVSAVGIILTNGSADKIGIKIAQGLYALYGISGYLSDVLSYSRLLALGLATGVIASVINMMGAMVAQGVGGIGGAIVFTVIMIFGHAFNLAINALGAYVHTNRLQYVELFGKFYDGGGIKFAPLKMNTKYFKFKESRKNG